MVVEASGARGSRRMTVEVWGARGWRRNRRRPAQKCDAARHSVSVPSAGSRARYTGFA